MVREEGYTINRRRRRYTLWPKQLRGTKKGKRGQYTPIWSKNKRHTNALLFAFGQFVSVFSFVHLWFSHNSTVDRHIFTRSHHNFTLAWAGQSHFHTGGLAGLGRTHIGVWKCDEKVWKCAAVRYLLYILNENSFDLSYGDNEVKDNNVWFNAKLHECECQYQILSSLAIIQYPDQMGQHWWSVFE